MNTETIGGGGGGGGETNKIKFHQLYSRRTKTCAVRRCFLIHYFRHKLLIVIGLVSVLYDTKLKTVLSKCL